MMTLRIAAYVYGAAIHCGDCIGETVTRQCEAAGIDREEYLGKYGAPCPVYAIDAEADTPQHCDTCGVFLDGYGLTNDGVDYVEDCFTEDSGHGDAETLCTWDSRWPWIAERMEESGTLPTGLLIARSQVTGDPVESSIAWMESLTTHPESPSEHVAHVANEWDPHDNMQIWRHGDTWFVYDTRSGNFRPNAPCELDMRFDSESAAYECVESWGGYMRDYDACVDEGMIDPLEVAPPY